MLNVEPNGSGISYYIGDNDNQYYDDYKHTQ
jgi:hypothetical protein